MVGRKAGPRGHGSMNKKQQQKKMQNKDSGGRSNGKKVGPQLASSLLKELKGDGDGRRKQSKEEEEDDSILPGDVYEYEEQLPEEEAGKNRRYDSVDQLDYELPSDFEVCFSLNFSESDEEGEEEKDDDEEEEEEEEEDAEKKHQNMLQAVTRKASEAQQEKASKRKEVMLSESYPESEFNLNPGGKGSVTTVQGISVEELMGSLHETAGFGALRKRMQQLEKRGAPVHPPLPKAMQEKVERKVGYEKTRDEITKWQPQVKMNREARTLFFNQKEEVVPSSTAALAAKFTPTTDMEKEIASVLSESKLGDVKAVEAAEALELNKLTVEEVRERQQRLAKMRSLLFQHEAKAKRVRNIKSKTFHRLQKDHKDRAEDTDAEAVKDAALKQEVKRAEERMTLKHKNTSRWAKRILKRGLKEHEDGSREAIAEQLRTHSMLTRKIQSVKMSSSSEESSSEEEGDEGDEGLAVGGKTRARLLAKAKMATVLALQGDGEAEIPTTGLFALPFMTRAIERKRKESQDEALAVLEQLEEAERGDAVFDKNINVGRAEDDKAWGTSHSGRLGFGDMSTPAMNPNRREKSRDGEDSMDEFDSDANLSDDEEDKIDGLGAWQRFNRMEKSVPTKVDNKNIPNAALAASSGKKKLNGKKSKMVAPLNPAEINAQIPTLQASEEEEGEDGANDQGMKLLDKTMSQEELIRRAFAGDDVEAEFVETKARALDEEVPRVEGPVSLPGWGQWTHIQQKKGQPAWILKEQESLKNKRDAALSRRKDAKLQFVMISEKMDKKASKFCASKVPFPYRSREVFERTIEMPIGRDYNTDKSTRDMTRPSEIKKAGVVIEPLKLNMSIVKNAKLDVLSHVVKRRRERDSGNKASSNQLGKKIRT
ncbi:unnamed protein product [Sphagnum troendelagicum]|uniref:U3 small nucleolar RNA-associated protein 14 n=1 Tax=Sphagnum troendelagicum TaxID=128251 RepID=A0ABP0V2Q8_9BRYO